MGWFTGIVVFIIVWWSALFLVLPFGHKRDVDGTPIFAGMKKKFILTTLLSMLIWVVIYLLIGADVISFQNMAKAMFEEDRVKI